MAITQEHAQQQRLPTRAELTIAISLEKSQYHDLTPVQKVATLMHMRSCTGDHCDQGGWNWNCYWYVSDWNSRESTREYYLRQAEEYVKLIDDPQTAIVAAEILLNKKLLLLSR